MNRDLGVWKSEDSALVLIDYQKEMFEVIRSETSADLVELNGASPLAGPAQDVIARRQGEVEPRSAAQAIGQRGGRPSA